jgi:hypothetical protein
VFGLKQPVLGIVASILVIAVSLGFVSLFDFPSFAGWVSYLIMSSIPMQIVIGITWGTNQPQFAAKQRQPIKGVLLAMLTVLAGAIVAPAYLASAGANATPPGPIPTHAIIISVITTFWWTIMMGGWPFKAFIKNEVAAGIALIVACYAVNFALFRLLFNYEFLQGTPVYVAAADPHGMFNAISILVFYVTCLSAMFLMVAFDLWPLSRFPAVMKQPILGIVWTAIVIALAGLVFWIGTSLMAMDLMVFMVTVPIPYIFGTIIVLNMLQNSLLSKLSQPAKGIANALLVIFIGTTLAQIYRALAPVVSGTLHSGPPSYDSEIWLASALLAVTFPLLIVFAEFFKFWPLQKQD